MHPGRALSRGRVVMVVVVFVLSSQALEGWGLPLLMSEPQVHHVAAAHPHPPGQGGRSWGMGPPSESMAALCRPASSGGGAS